jgi:hypothetical protein
MAHRSGRRLRAEVPTFYLALLVYPLRQGMGARAWLLAALVALSQAMTLAGVVRELLVRRRRASEPTSATAPVLHRDPVTPQS